MFAFGVAVRRYARRHDVVRHDVGSALWGSLRVGLAAS